MNLDNLDVKISDLIEESHNTAKEKGWWEVERNIGELLALMHSEISEALEEWRSGKPLNWTYYEGTKPCGFTIELADLLIRVADLCGRHNLPLANALRVKLEYNQTRPYRHGGKLA